MGLFNSIARAVAPAVIRSPSGSYSPSYGGVIPALGSVPSASGLNVNQGSAMTVSTVYACVTRRAVDLARCTPRVMRLADDGEKTIVKNHPVNRVLRRPNMAQTWFEFAVQMHIGHLLRGNAYAAKIRDRNGDVVKLIPINPDAVMVLEAEDGSWFYNVNRLGLWQIAMLRDFPPAIPAEDVLHIRGLSFNTLVGVSTIGLARDAIGLDMALSQQASRWAGNGARPSGVLQTDNKLTKDAAARLKQSWQDFVGGLQNVGGTAVLEEGLKWQQVQLSSVDMEFIAQRNFSVLDICRFFRVPPHKVAVADRAASMNIPQQDQDYANNTIAPDVDLWEGALGHSLGLDDEDLVLDMDLARLLRADLLTRYNAYRTAILSGFLTPNEARKSEGLPPQPGADMLLVPSNTAALGSDVSGTGADEAGKPPGGQSPGPSTGTGGNQPNTKPVGEGSEDDDGVGAN